ncbi:hypothetical protein WT19_04195 [Burkholderia stagnalis]|nr:hypothetical protein [Burkholderia pseudomallei]KVO47488.1 hypothetical protein WT17_06650 [Burkholderia stagnalis]KVO79859.1 hypothetical protein WT19_04195 [Burkholderia stagnalis]KVW55971.1 hypothetical protein WT28_27925 [Burkholderia stagnalis]MDV2177221.1 hypothetical protein [Burkholderia pseudomallei]
MKSTMTSRIPEVQRAAKPLLREQLPQKAYMTLNEVIDFLAQHYVEIPEDVAKQIEDFVRTWLNDPGRHPFAHHLPPTSTLVNLYRRWAATSILHWELMECENDGPAWRNWLSTGQAVRLDSDGTTRATAMLECIVHDSARRFESYLNGTRPLGQATVVATPPLFNEKDREWLDCLGFDTKAMIDFLSADSSTQDEYGTEPSCISTSLAVAWFAPKKHMTKAEFARWKETFSNPPKNLKETAQKSQGQGKEALWNPVQVALWLYGNRKGNFSLRILDDIFEREAASEWKGRWAAEAQRIRNTPGFAG